MASNTFRSDPRRAAEIACILTQYAASVGATVKPHLLADAVAAMQKAARAAKRQAEHACNWPLTVKEEERATKRQEREAARINDTLRDMLPATRPQLAPGHTRECYVTAPVEPPTIELGGDPRGPCARLHIPGQRGDGWGEGFAIY